MANENHRPDRLHLVPHPGGGSLRGFLKEMFSSMMDDDITGRSAQLAYYFFFAIFPGFIFLSSLADVVSTGGEGVRTIVLRHLGSTLPPQAFGILQEAFNKTGHTAGGLTFGVVLSLWSATVGMSAACDTLNAVHDVRESRPWWKVQLTALGLTLIITLLVLCTVATFFAGDSVSKLTSSGAVHALIGVAQWAVAICLAALIFGLTYYLAPDVKDRAWHWITPGAAMGILVWIAASIGLAFYVKHFSSYSSSYGSIGAVMVLLLWFYIAGFALLTGGEVNAVIEDIAARRGDPEATRKGDHAPGQAA